MSTKKIPPMNYEQLNNSHKEWKRLAEENYCGWKNANDRADAAEVYIKKLEARVMAVDERQRQLRKDIITFLKKYEA